jgi:hypothetical protein
MSAKIPDLFLHNILPEPRDFMLVVGKYNADVCRSWAQPVAGLSEQGWFPEYATMFPFAHAKQIEVVISRIVPQLPAGSTDCNPESTKHAVESADKDTNIGFVFSLLRSGWARERCILSNGGVFHTAQERFESRHFPTHRKEYFRHFTKLSEVRVRDVAALCEPPAPARPPNPPILRSARQICKSPAHWDALPESEKARMLAEEQSQWMNKYTPAWDNSSRSRIDIGIAAPPSFDERTDTENWKLPPTDEERAGTEDNSWK